MLLTASARACLAPCLLLAAAPAWCQAPSPPAAPAAAASAPPQAVPPAPAPQRVEITGGRDTDTEERRRSTAAKIVIGREEIEKFGDATVGEVLRRLPGVTTPGAPGRGGPPRLRGLGSGFTQLLIDGQRLPPGFSLDSLTPEQIERIEVLRAPTAETGARAIAGTINIITREGFKKRLNDLRVGGGFENGAPSGGVFWSHNDNVDQLTYTLSAGLFANKRKSESSTETRVTDALGGGVLESRDTQTVTDGRTIGLNLNARLQWRLGEGGDSLVLMPGLFANRGRSFTRFDITENLLPRPTTPEYADDGSTRGHSGFTGPRLTVQYRQRVGDWRLEGGGNGSISRSTSVSDRYEYRANRDVLRTQYDETDSREKRLTLNGKASRIVGSEGSEHSLVSGAELETARRDDTRISVPDLADFGDTFAASTQRAAAYVQDEWNLSPAWAAHAGLRWEGIRTQGDAGREGRPVNTNSVFTPLVHLLWKPDPKKRDQVRLSLTRSWRAPETNQLIGKPSINRLRPAPGPNDENYPDSAGNPYLKPELATGIDLAFERYLEGGGLLSANLFARRIKDMMRSNLATPENVPWNNGNVRWVRRTRNIGTASTQGLELEAKFRLDQVVADTPPVELRANVSLYRSRVDSVPGPDNRLDQQPKGTANLGADYRWRGTPFTLGGNVNWVPATTTRFAADNFSTVTAKRQWDLYALWAINPGLALRLMANNLDPLDYSTTTVNDSVNNNVLERSTVKSGGPSYTNWQLRLELKL